MRPNLPLVRCSGCVRPMTVKIVKPIMFADALDEVTYVCEQCGTETKRNMKLRTSGAGAAAKAERRK
jgi:thymidine kinase